MSMGIFKKQLLFGRQRGFTLIEILIVIALISVLAIRIITLIDPAQQLRKGRDTQRKSGMRQIQTALELYRADVGQYPNALPACGSPLTNGVVTYIQKFPCDPKNTTQYVFSYESNLSSYSVIACLENTTDPQKDTVNRARPTSGTYCDGTTGWSYTLTNP